MLSNVMGQACVTKNVSIFTVLLMQTVNSDQFSGYFTHNTYTIVGFQCYFRFFFFAICMLLWQPGIKAFIFNLTFTLFVTGKLMNWKHI